MLKDMTVVNSKQRSHSPGTLRNTHSTRNQLVRALDPQKVDISADKSPGKRDLAAGNGGRQLSVGDKVEKQTEKPRHTFLDNMEAIAFDVEAWFEEETSYSRRVAETTVDIARAFGIPEDEIERWAASRLARLIRDTEKLGEIKSRLERLQGSFIGQADNKDAHEER